MKWDMVICYDESSSACSFRYMLESLHDLRSSTSIRLRYLRRQEDRNRSINVYAVPGTAQLVGQPNSVLPFLYAHLQEYQVTTTNVKLNRKN